MMTLVFRTHFPDSESSGLIELMQAVNKQKARDKFLWAGYETGEEMVKCDLLLLSTLLVFGKHFSLAFGNHHPDLACSHCIGNQKSLQF